MLPLGEWIDHKREVEPWEWRTPSFEGRTGDRHFRNSKHRRDKARTLEVTRQVDQGSERVCACLQSH